MRHFDLASKYLKAFTLLVLITSSAAPILADDADFERVVEQNLPHESIEVSSDDLRPIQLRNGFEYVMQIPTHEQEAVLSTLSDRELSQFYRKRRNFLSKFAKLLNATQIFYGPGIVIGNSMQQLAGRTETSDAADAEGISQYRYAKNQMIRSLLAKTETKIFEKARVFAGANEQGISIAIGAGGGILLGRFGALRTAAVGVSFAYNFATDKIVFEFYRQNVRAISGGAMVVGISFGATWYSARTDENGQINRRMVGDAVGIPGPFSMTFFEERITRTLSQGLAVGMSTYLGENNRQILFRGMISNPFAGFIKIMGESGLGLYHLATAPVETVVNAVLSRIRDVKRGKCTGEFRDD